MQAKMTGRLSTCLVLLCALVCAVDARLKVKMRAPTAAPVAAFTCAGKADGQYRDKTDVNCLRYWVCNNGTRTEGVCRMMLQYFHDATGGCADGRPAYCAQKAIVPGSYGTVCYGRQPFAKKQCITQTSTVTVANQVRAPTAVLMEITGTGLPALPLVDNFNLQSITYTSIVANKQQATGAYEAEYLLVQDTQPTTLRNSKFQYGDIQVTAFETVEKCVSVTFLQTMAEVPTVKLSAHSNAAAEIVYYWLKEVSTTGFKACFHEGVLFSGVHALNMHYVAIASQGQVSNQRDIQLEHGRTRLMAGSAALQGTTKFCKTISFALTYRARPFVFTTAEQDANSKCTSTFISYVAAITSKGATICARNSEDSADGTRVQNVTINYMVFGGRIDIVPGMVQLKAVTNAPTVFCEDVTFPANKFWTGLPMHVQLTVTWQKTPVLTNSNHEASAVWAESLTHTGFKACALVAGRHFADNYPIPAVNWLAYQIPTKSCVVPPLTGGVCQLPEWYTGARCCVVNLGNQGITPGSKILVSVRHSKVQTYIDAMTAWAEISTSTSGATCIRLCARELQNFDGLHQNLILEWLLVDTALPPFVPEIGEIQFARKRFGINAILTMPAACADLTFTQDYSSLPIATVILSPKNKTQGDAKGCYKCNHHFSTNDLVTWIETRTATNMRVCMKSIRACMYREAAHLSYIVVTEPRCAGRANGFHLKDGDTLCHDYFQCNDGAYSDGSCGPNRYFNLQTGQCQNAVPNGCQDPRCINVQNGFYLINTVCKSYYQCNNGFYTAFTCANNGYFNLQAGSCQAGVPAGCQDPRCANVQNGFYLLNNLCTSYYQCNNGFYSIFSCQQNQYYNLQTGQCQANVPAGCQDPKCIGQTNGFYLVNNLCRSYFRCNDGIYTLSTCTANNFFNLQTGQCQTTVPAGCQDPRCTSLTDGFYLVNNICKSYYQCQGGFYNGFTCPNNGYFNRQNNQCQTGVPTGCQDPRCVGKNNGNYLINNLCKSYYACNDGFYTGGSCNANQYFSLANGVCQDALPTGCQDPRCTSRTDGFYRLNNFCTSYFRCQGGFYTGGQCNNGQYFDLTSNTCVSNLPTGCRDPRCTGIQNGFYLVNTVCKSYYQCNDGFYSAFTCANNGYYNIQSRQCQATVPSGCQDPRCSGRQDGVYLLNNLCTSYYRCSNGQYTINNCNNGQYFNTQTGSCQTNLPTGCQDPRCTTRGDGVFVLNNLCTSYFRCAQGIYTLSSCSNGQYFNSQTGSCGTQLPTGCQDPRCIGRTGSFVLNTLCTQFFTCNNGIYNVQSCQTGQYFNSQSSSCQTTLPSGCQDSRCQGRQNGNFRIATDSQCRTYFTCQGGVYSVQSCGSNQYFHSATSDCRSTLPAGCADPRCSGRANGNYKLATDTSCTQFFTCTGGVYSVNTCAANEYFHSSDGKCKFSVPAGCTDPRCSGLQNGNYRLANDKVCKQYFQCFNGDYSLNTCPNNGYFHINLAACTSTVPSDCADPRCQGITNGNYRIQGDTVCRTYFTCQNGVYSINSCANNQYFTQGQGCSTNLPAGCQDPRCQGINNGNYRIQGDTVCRTYFSCQNGIYSVNSCGSNQYFTPGQGCSTNVPSGCQDPRCNNIADGRYLLNNICTSYYTCTGGQYTVNNCPAQTPYFNNQNKQCQATVPSGCQDSRCIGRTANQKYLLNNLCGAYFSCSSTGAYSLFQCQPNQYFNVQTGNCQSTVPSGCQDPRCSGRNDGWYVTNNFCTGYYRCQSGQATLGTCSNGQFFNVNTQQCQSTTPSGCQDSFCQTQANGNFPVDTICRTYYTCNNGFKTTNTCPTNQYYNSQTRQCQSGVPNGCQDPDCTARGNGNYVIDTSCAGYFICLNGIKTVGQCITGLYYSTATGSCVSSRPSGCASAQCAGKTDGNYFLNNLCLSYFTCTGGAYALVNCPNGQYFNQQTRLCQNGLPAGCTNPQCQGRQDGRYLTNNLCGSYFTCTGGAYQLTNCGNNQYFNDQTKQCQTQVPANCQSPLCQGRISGYTQITDGGACNAYFKCNNGFQTFGNCNAGQFMNTQTGNCQSTSPAGCGANFACANQNDGNYVLATDATCRTYFTCSSNIYAVVTCPNGGYFNSGSRQCQTQVPAGCQGQVVNNLCATRNNGVYVTDQYCQTYYQCVNNQLPSILSCNTGQTYNSQTGGCSSQVNIGSCYHPTCYTTQTVNGVVQRTLRTGRWASDATCTGGYTCNNGLISNQISCPNQGWFNAGTGNCQTTNPGSCNARQVVVQNSCLSLNNGWYHADAIVNSNNGQGGALAFCRSYFQCVNNQIPTIQTCSNTNTGQATYINRQNGACQTTLPANQNCADPRCYNVGQNNLVVLKNNGNYAGDAQCTVGYSCTAGLIQNVLGCTGVNRYYNLATGQCQSAQPSGCQAQPALVQTCAQMQSTCPANSFCVDISGVGTCRCNANLVVVNGACVGGQNIQVNQLRLTGAQNTWVPALATPTSAQHVALARSIEPTLLAIATADAQANNVQLLGVQVTSMTQGSVVVGFTIVYSAAVSTAQKTRVETAYKNALAAGNLDGISADKNTAPTVVQPSAGPTCSGRDDNDRIAHESDAKKFYVCSGGKKGETKTCPTEVIFPANAANGQWFSPYFKTCINTTTGQAPKHVPTGEADMCNEIATYVSFGFSGTRLPDVKDCKKWVTCVDQKFSPQSVGSCVSQPYNPDKQFCEFTHKCFFPNPAA